MNLREDLKAFVDGELQEPRLSEVRTAVSDDSELMREVAELRSISKALRHSIKRTEPVGIEATLSRVRERTARRTWAVALNLGVATAIGALAIAMLFPVFAQSKAAAKRASALADAKMKTLKEESAVTMSEAPANAGEGRSRYPSESSANGGFSGRIEGNIAKRPATEQPTQPRTSAVKALVIKTAQLQVEVADVSKAQASSSSLAAALGGYVENKSASSFDGGSPTAELTLRVPSSGYDHALRRLRELGKVIGESEQGKDVTAQVIDTEARLKVMRAEEEQYTLLLKSARTIAQILQVKDELTQVRQEIESLDAQRKNLRSQAQYATISLTLTQKPKKVAVTPSTGDWSSGTWKAAVSGLTALGRVSGQIGIYLVVFAPVWLPILIVWRIVNARLDPVRR